MTSNSVLRNLENATNYKITENGAVAHKTTTSAVMDLFALGGAYRGRSVDDCVTLFKAAFKENREYALKCLFYLRDVRGGQGERRFFRVCFNWLAKMYPNIARKNIQNIAAFGRYDDILYACAATDVMKDALNFVKDQLAIDLESKVPSLLAKWLPSENASSANTRAMGNIVRQHINLTHKQYRKILSDLRSRINIVEKLMSEGRWDEIEFDKIPSKAGLIYKNAFARRDIIAKKYENFAQDKNTTVNAAALYPYEIVRKAIKSNAFATTDRAMLEKFWDNQIDVLEGRPCKMICVVDTSGSMTWSGVGQTMPIDMAIGLGMYCAERVGGPFKDHFISFSRYPQLIKVEGVDFFDKVRRIYNTNLCENTNLVATFELLKRASINAKPKDRLDTVVVISDMEIDSMSNFKNKNEVATEMEVIRKEWAEVGLEMPRLVYWNVNARNDTILDLGPNVTLCSGASPMLFKQIATGKTGWDLFLDTVVNNERYSVVTV